MIKVVDLRPTYLQDGSMLYGEVQNANDEGVTVTLNDGTVVIVQGESVTVKLPSNEVISNVPNNGLGDGKVVGSTMMAVGGAVAVFVPVGTIVGAILAAAGALISAFSNGKAARKAAEEAGKYENSNVILQNENAQLDSKITDLQNAIVKAKKDLGVADGGLGWCLINCAKNKAKERLKTAKEIFEELNKGQELRVQTFQNLTAEVERLFLKKKNLNYWYIGTGAVVLGALIYFIAKKS